MTVLVYDVSINLERGFEMSVSTKTMIDCDACGDFFEVSQYELSVGLTLCEACNDDKMYAMEQIRNGGL